MVCVFQENPSVVCGAIGLCQSQQAALAKVQVQQNEQLLSNEIPKVDLSQNETPFLLNVPLLLYPQNPKDDTPKQTPKQVWCFCFEPNVDFAAPPPPVLHMCLNLILSRKVLMCARTASPS